MITGRIMTRPMAPAVAARTNSARAPFTASRYTRRKGRPVALASKAEQMSQASSATLNSAPKSELKKGLTYTHYESNSFLLGFEASGTKLLVDPWLYGDLIFYDQGWLARGKKRVVKDFGDVAMQELKDTADAILLTQWVEDHCHMRTLERLPRTLPIIANPEAADKIKPLAYENVTVIDHGQTRDVCSGKLRIQATRGALVGPPWSKRQNGYYIREAVANGVSVYYEPHCDFVEEDLKGVGNVDVVISPVDTTVLALGLGNYNLTQGDIGLPTLLKRLEPKTLLPLMNTGINLTGAVSNITSYRGNIDKTKDVIKKMGLAVTVQMPVKPGDTLHFQV